MMIDDQRVRKPYEFKAVTRFRFIPWFTIWEVSFEEIPAFRISCSYEQVSDLVFKLNAAWLLGFGSGVLHERFRK